MKLHRLAAYGRLGVLSIALALSAGAATSQARGYTVADAIGMSHFADPDVRLAHFGPMRFQTSPDGQHVAYVIRRGNLATGANDFTLHIMSIPDISRFLKAGPAATAPEGAVVARLSSTSNDFAISHLQWLDDSRTIVFLGAEGDAPRQVYRLDTQTRALTRLTAAPRSVEVFSLDPKNGKLVYLSNVPTYYPERGQPAFVVGYRYFEEVRKVNEERLLPSYQFFVQDIGNPESARALGTPFGLANPPGMPISISPDGRRAISSRNILLDDAHRRTFRLYKPFNNASILTHLAQPSADAPPMPSVFEEFVLLDFEAGTVSPLIDAPTGSFGSAFEPRAYWRDNRHAVLANSFLPLAGTTGAERARREAGTAILELDTRNGQTSVIRWLEPPAADRKVVRGVRLAGDGAILLEYPTPNGSVIAQERLVRGPRGWTAAPYQPAAATAPAVTFSIHQALDQPPTLWARDVASGQERLLHDPNPDFGPLVEARAEVLQWRMPEMAWRAGLLYPLGYKPGQRYPLVIQTHGFFPDQFLIDGPNGAPSAFAAQPLAAQGFFVLQLPDPVPLMSSRAEITGTRAAIEQIIATLDQRGLIDTARMGLIGWSRTGNYVQDLITYSRYRFAAATVADASMLSLNGYAAWYGFLPGAAKQTAAMMGAEPWGDQIDTWVANDPMLHMANIRTPLRIELYNRALTGWWELYATLRYHDRPVEMVYFPKADHFLIKPAERWVSQQGTVDWFRFWLKGEKDADPAKTEQYRRWQVFKDQLQAAEISK